MTTHCFSASAEEIQVVENLSYLASALRRNRGEGPGREVAGHTPEVHRGREAAEYRVDRRDGRKALQPLLRPCGPASGPRLHRPPARDLYPRGRGGEAGG